MPQFDKSEKEENASCSGIDLAAHALSQQAFSRGTLSAENTRGSDCAKIPQFSSSDELMAEVERRKAAGLDPIKGFELTGKGNDPKYARDALYGIEDALGKKVDFTFFRADNGNMEVFILGLHDKTSSSPDVQISQTKSEKPAPAACVDIGDTVDPHLNRQLRLPPGTVEREAIKVNNERKHEAELVREGIDPNAPADEVQRIHAERTAAIAQLQKPESDSPDYSRYLLDVRAMQIGLSPGVSADDLSRTRVDYNQQAEAILLGLNRYATHDDIVAANKEINDVVDPQYNAANGLPATATMAEAFKIQEKRAHDSELAANGFDPSMSRSDLQKFYSERSARINELRDQSNQPGVTPEQRQRLELQMKAVNLGISENSTAAEIEQTKEAYSTQGLAVMMGLSRDATRAEIDAALARSQAYDNSRIPENLCAVKTAEPEKKNKEP